MFDIYYRAVNLEGKEVKGSVKCEDEKALKDKLRQEGFFIISLNKKLKPKLNLYAKKITNKELSLFCKQFCSLLESGISILEILNIMSSQNSNKIIKSSLETVRKEVNKGKPLSDSLRTFDYIYPELMLSMIEVGEMSGKLPLIFHNLDKYFDKKSKLIKKIKSSLTYPLFVFVTIIFVTTFLVYKIIPEFENELQVFKGKLPEITILVLNISKFFREKILLLALIFIMIFICLHYFLKTKKGAFLKDYIKLSAPFVKVLYSKIYQINITTFMGIMISGGSTAYRAMEILQKSIGNVILKDKIYLCISEIRSGGSLAVSLKNINILEPSAISMVAIGEEMGNLEEMFYSVSKILEDELVELLDNSVALVEPILIVLLSGVVGTVVFSVMLPMLNLMDALS